MNWLPFISPKRADNKRLQDQTQFNWMVHFISNTETHVWRARPTAANHSHEDRAGFLPVWKQRNEFQQIKQNRVIFVWMKKAIV